MQGWRRYAGRVWYGIVCLGTVWYGTLWYGMVWYGMVCMVGDGMVLFGTVGKLWHSMVWYSWYAGRVEGLPAEALQPLLLPLNLHILYHIFLQTQFFDPNKNI